MHITKNKNITNVFINSFTINTSVNITFYKPLYKTKCCQFSIVFRWPNILNLQNLPYKTLKIYFTYFLKTQIMFFKEATKTTKNSQQQKTF